MARLFARAGDPARAKEQFIRATLLSRACETAAQKIDALYRIACEYADASLHNEASVLLTELHSLVIDPASEVDTAYELINVAEIYSDIQQTEEARSILEEALKITRENKDNWFKAERLTEIAQTYIDLDDISLALPLLQEALPVVNQIDEINRPYFWLRIVDCCIRTNQKTEAAKVLQEILTAISHYETAQTQSGGMIEVAEKYLQLGETQSAVDLLGQSRSIAERIDDANDKIAMLIEIGSLLGEAGQKEKSLEAAGQARELIDKLTENKSAPFLLGNLSVLLAESGEKEKASQIIDDVIRIVPDLRIKTSGFGAIVSDLAAAGDPEIALRLAAIIREPEVQADAFTSVAGSFSLM